MKFAHNGYELEKIFNVHPYRGLKLYQRMYIEFVQLLATLNIGFYGKLINMVFKKITVPENFIYYEDVFNHKKENCLYQGTWQSEKYFPHVTELIKQEFRFKEELLSEYTKSIAYKIKGRNSVAIHIRRGDYLNKEYGNGFTGCTDICYYKKAINYMYEKLDNPIFYVFSDDSEYAKKHFSGSNMEVVDGNKGVDSWQDMYLMSICSHNIIANSSFSWWGAFLNANSEKIVIAPKRWWYAFEKDDVVPEKWIRI